MQTTLPMHFNRYGRTYQLSIRSANDLAHVVDLDEAHWVATGTATSAIHLDPAFEGYLDTDSNGRIMCFEIKDAILWLLNHLSDRSDIDARSTTLRLAALDINHDSGANLLRSAQTILRQLNTDSMDTISLEQVRTMKAATEQTPVSAAGVVIPDATDDPALRQFITDIISTLGGTDHPCGKPGVTREHLTAFVAAAREFLDWHARCSLTQTAEAHASTATGTITAAMFDVFAALKPHIDCFFAQCDVIGFDARAADLTRPSDEALKAVRLNDTRTIETLLKQSPICEPRAKGNLFLDERANPAFLPQLQKLRSTVLNDILHRDTNVLTHEDWVRVKNHFVEHEAWLDEKQGAAVEKLGKQRLRECLDPSYAAKLNALIEESSATAKELGNIRQVEKLILCQAHILTLVNNFTSFPYLYDPHERAVFEIGTLVIDGRHLTFSVRVEDRKAHRALAQSSNIFVVYAEITPGPDVGTYRGKEETPRPYIIAAPVTYGGKGNLCIGKRGIFEDIHGNEADASVVEIIENPISIVEAMISPFQRLGRMLTGKIEAMATLAEKGFENKAETAVTQLQTGGSTGGAAPKALPTSGLLIGGSVAIAALGSALAFITKTLSELKWHQILVGIAVAILAVMIPVCMVTLMKLRKRDLGAILEGSGWAINARMRLTFKQGRMFTRRPAFPADAKGLQRQSWLGILLALLAGVALAFLFTVA